MGIKVSTMQVSCVDWVTYTCKALSPGPSIVNMKQMVAIKVIIMMITMIICGTR